MIDPSITREVTGLHGRYVLRRGDATAELSYAVVGPALVAAEHTVVPDVFRGTGTGLALVTRLVSDARAEGFRVVPQCPFVNAMRQRHPEWADAFATWAMRA